MSITRLRNHGALNGTIGRVVEYNQATSRYEVRATETGQLFRVKPDNVVPLADQEKPPLAPPSSGLPDEPTQKKIRVGCVVVLFGLKNAAALNGEEAEVLGIDEEKARMDIRLKSDGSVKKVKSDNVRLVEDSSVQTMPGEFEPGQIVLLCNLRSAASLNGEQCEIRRKDNERYEIRLLKDGSTKKVRRENLKLCV